MSPQSIFCGTGSGKQTVVRLATEDLGMHVVEFNCYDFVGTSEGKTAAALMNAFKSAKRFVEWGHCSPQLSCS